MRERVTRFALAPTLTALDIAVAESSVGVIWQAWSGSSGSEK